MKAESVHLKREGLLTLSRFVHALKVRNRTRTPTPQDSGVGGKSMQMLRRILECARSPRLSVGRPWAAAGLLLLSTMAYFPARGETPDSAQTFFRQGIDAYRSGDYARAAVAFGESERREAAPGTLRNLGIAEWQRGEVGRAILAWEQTLWVNPFEHATRQNLQFARRTAQVESPNLAWYEEISNWLPASWWAWITVAGLWLAIGMLILPGVFRQRKAAWHQAVAALGFMVFLLSLPAQLGVHTRSQLGFVVEKNAPLRLTPTADAQVVIHLAEGKPVRSERAHGNYVLVRTPEGQRGWLDQQQLGFIGSGVLNQ